MRLARLLSPLLLVSVPVAVLTAQIPTRKPSTVSTPSGPKLLVANPYTFVSQDSAAAVQVGSAIRNRMDKVAGGTYAVVSRQQMNEALKQFGYPADAILSLTVQRTFGSTLQSRALLSSSLAKAEGGRYTVTARLAGMSDDAGTTVVVSQSSGQSLEDVGNAVADAFSAAIKVQADARACIDQRTTAPAKALASAKKALVTMPTNGLAHYCLAVLALDKATKADSAAALKELQDAVAGDQLSLPAWTMLAAQYEVRGDTTKTVEALQQMLRVAPSNQPLREQAFKLFIKYGRPDAAEQAALDGLKIDPTNADLWDLLSNARVYKGDFAGAVDALEQVIANDSTKADSAFYLKITVMASQKPDTSRFLRWAQAGAQRFPNNLELLKQLLSAYQVAGPSDSVVAVTGRLIQKDTTAVVPALAAAQALQTANKFDDAQPFLDFAAKYGDAQAKEAVAGLMFNAARPLLQPPQDWPGAAVRLRKVVAFASPTGRFAGLANYYLGLSLLQQIPPLDADAERQKSCDLAKQEDAMAQEAEAAFKLAPADQADNLAKFQKYLGGLKPRVASMLKVYCK